MKNLKLKLLAGALAVLSLFGIFSLRSLGPNMLLVSAISGPYKLERSFFRSYIKTFKAIPGNYRTEMGVPAIQFIANGRDDHLNQFDGATDLIDYFLRNGAKIDETSKDKLGLTVLHTALLNNDLFLIKFLIAKGANVNALATGERFRGMTPLRFAKEIKANESSSEFSAIQLFLKEKGAHE